MTARGPRSDAGKAILAFIQENAPATQEALHDRFRQQANAAGSSVGAWLCGRLANLEACGFIQRTSRGWIALDASGRPASKPRERAAPLGPDETSVAQPRRVGMFGPVYQPPAQVHRVGSMDYAAKPSVINGQARTYRSAW